MILSDELIRLAIADQELECYPLHDSQFQPASIDLTLGDAFLHYREPAFAIFPRVLLPHDQGSWEDLLQHTRGDYLLLPGQFVLGTTVETIGLPVFGQGYRGLVGRVEGKSTLARLGLTIHQTGGYVDPGFRGQITLEIANVNRYPILLTPGMRICQISFAQCGPVARPYALANGNKYANQEGVTAPRSS